MVATFMRMDLAACETRLGVRLSAIERTDPLERAEIVRTLLFHERELDDSVFPLCERLLPLLNLKGARELSELIERRWPESELAARLRAESASEAERDRTSVSPALARAGVTAADLGRRGWWVVRAPDDLLAQGFFDDHVVRIGFSSVTDLRSLPANRADIAADWEAHYPDVSRGRVSMSATQLHRFAHEIEVGDVVVTPVTGNRSVSIGLIDGDYDWEDELPDFCHFRRTHWLRHGIQRDRLSADAHEELSYRPTVFPVRRARRELLDLL